MTKDEEQYEKAAREAIMDWMKCATGICNHWDKEDVPCGKDRAKEPPQRAIKRYEVLVEGLSEHIIGEGFYISEDDRLVILSDIEGQDVAAVFNEWDYFKVTDEAHS